MRYTRVPKLLNHYIEGNDRYTLHIRPNNSNGDKSHEDHIRTDNDKIIEPEQFTNEGESNKVDLSSHAQHVHHKAHYGCHLSYLGCKIAFSDLKSWRQHHREAHSNLAPRDMRSYIVLSHYCCSLDDPSPNRARHQKGAKHLCSKQIGKPGGTSFLTPADLSHRRE